MRIIVRDLMSPVAAMAKDTATIAAARDLMLRWDAAEVYVVDARRRLLGVVPDYEFLKAELSGLPDESPITELLCAKIESVEASANIATVLSKFREGWCGRIAVIEKGRLVGRLTRAEVLRLVVGLRAIATVTEATAERRLAGSRIDHAERLTPIRKLSRTARPSGSRRVRRLAAG